VTITFTRIALPRYILSALAQTSLHSPLNSPLFMTGPRRRIQALRHGHARGAHPSPTNPMKWLLISLLCLSCTGCGLAAAPCRVTSAVIKIVPVVGGVAAAPTDACAEVID
jgi:hypothetical protein